MSETSTVLVAEDNDFVRMQLVRFLSEGGYRVCEAADGATALEVCKQTKVDAAIVDIRMEPMDGFEFIKSLRSSNNVMPCVLVTGDHNPDLLSEAAKWNVSAVLMKPVQKDRLLQMVSRALQPRNR